MDSKIARNLRLDYMNTPQLQDALFELEQRLLAEERQRADAANFKRDVVPAAAAGFLTLGAGSLLAVVARLALDAYHLPYAGDVTSGFAIALGTGVGLAVYARRTQANKAATPQDA